MLLNTFRNRLREFAFKNAEIIARFNSTTKMASLAAILLVIPFAVQKPQSYQTALKLDVANPNILVPFDNTVNIMTVSSRADINAGTRGLNPEAIKALMQEIAPEYGVDWKFVYAIGYLESGYNSSLARRNYNFFGRKATSTSYRKYDNPESAIRDQFAYLKDHYFVRGLDTPQEVGPIYCEGNTWASKVTSIMRTL